MSKTVSYLIIFGILTQIITSYLRYPDSNYHILLVLLLLMIIGLIFYKDFLRNPLKRCPLCKQWLKIKDYKFISNDGIEAIVLCQKCNREYKIKKINSPYVKDGNNSINLIKKLKKKLDDEYPNIKYEIKDNTLTVSPVDENGFIVGVSVFKKACEVFCGDLWHERFIDEEQAFNCFGSCLNNKFRLKVSLKGDFEYQGTMERFENGQWQEVSTVSIFFFPFWRKNRVKYLQNNLIDPMT